MKVKDPNTLYVVTDENNVGYLYLGDILLSGNGNVTTIGATSLKQLLDISLSNELTDDSFLSYDDSLNRWVDKSISLELQKVIPKVFIGATQTDNGTSGLVPTPIAGELNKFLNSSGNWTEITIQSVKNLNEKLNELFQSINDFSSFKTSTIESLNKTSSGLENLKTIVQNNYIELNRKIENIPNEENFIILKTKVGSLEDSFISLNENFDSIEESVEDLQERMSWQSIAE